MPVSYTHLDVYKRQVHIMTLNPFTHEIPKPKYCPFCCTPIWGEGWDPNTRDRFYSHVKHNDACAFELAVDVSGNWRRI